MAKVTYKGRHSLTYRFTVDLKSEEDMAEVAELRKMIKEINKVRKFIGKNPLYVKLQGRGANRLERLRKYAKEHYSKMYPNADWSLYSPYSHDLPLSVADTADVYVYERNF